MDKLALGMALISLIYITFFIAVNYFNWFIKKCQQSVIPIFLRLSKKIHLEDILRNFFINVHRAN